MNDLNQLFPHKVCINLDRRPDRWARMRAEFARHGVRAVRRFPAADGLELPAPPGWEGTAGAYGCLRSHLEVVKEARARRLPSVLIFEDDLVFAPRLGEDFRAYFRQVPDDWEMLHLGALHVAEPAEVSANVRRISRAYSTYAYALKQTVYDAFIELNEESLAPVDINNHALQAARPCYCFAPHLAWVEPDRSDVQERQKDHWYLRESLVIHGTGIEELLAATSLVLAYGGRAGGAGGRRNLLFLAGHYRRRTPGVEVVVVEQGAEPSLAPEDLPEGCRLLFLSDAGPLDRARCFNAGARAARPASSLLVFSDADLFVEEWDLRGNLRMCQRYDATAGCGEVLPLTPADTLELHRRQAMLTPWFDARQYQPEPTRGDLGAYPVFNRRAFDAAGGWRDHSPALSLKDSGRLRLFRPPNQALRLHQG